jgi:hypothetical protein
MSITQCYTFDADITGGRKGRKECRSILSECPRCHLLKDTLINRKQEESSEVRAKVEVGIIKEGTSF